MADGLAQASNHAVETSRTRVVSADDDVLLREGLASLLPRPTAGCWLCSLSWRPANVPIPAGCNVDGAACWQTDTLKLRCVIVDIRLGEELGFDAARQLADRGQAAPVIMISTHPGGTTPT